MRFAVCAQRDPPLIAVKPAIFDSSGPNRRASWRLPKTSNAKGKAVGIGEAMFMIALHCNAFIVVGNGVAALGAK